MSTKALSELEFWDVKKLIPYKKNAKIHTPEQIDKLAAIIQKQGFKQPLHIDEKGVIITGHGRRLAAMKLGMEKLPVFVERGLTEAEKDAMRISDNMISSADYDRDLLGEEIARLVQEVNFGALDFGISDNEFENILDGIVDDLQGLGDGLDDLSSDIDQPETQTEPPTAPKTPKEAKYERTFFITIQCKSESQQEEIHDKLTELGIEHKISVM